MVGIQLATYHYSMPQPASKGWQAKITHEEWHHQSFGILDTARNKQSEQTNNTYNSHTFCYELNKSFKPWFNNNELQEIHWFMSVCLTTTTQISLCLWGFVTCNILIVCKCDNLIIYSSFQSKVTQI